MLFDYDDMEAEFAAGEDPAAKPRSRLIPSPWLGSTRYNVNARIRLFYLAGVGTPAYLYPQWVSQEMHQRFPAVEIAAIELPGHGDHKGIPFHDYVECARALAAELQRIHFRQDDRRMQPFAIYGFSLGSRIAAELAAILKGPNGEQCKKLYVGGRAAPHIENPVFMMRPELEEEQSSTIAATAEVFAELDNTLEPSMPDSHLTILSMMRFAPERVIEIMMRLSPEKVKDIMTNTLAPTISADSLSKYQRMFEKCIRKEPEELYAFAKATISDQSMAAGPFKPISFDESEERGAFGQPVAPCPIHFYHAGEDTLWPLQPEGKYLHPESWAHYTKSGFTWSTCPSVGHGEMGSARSPALELICEDLVLLVAGTGGD